MKQPMPLRDHFRPPLDNLRHWESLPGGWPMMIVASLQRKLPRRYFAELRVHSGASAEIDVAAFEEQGEEILAVGNGTRRLRHRPAGSGRLRGPSL